MKNKSIPIPAEMQELLLEAPALISLAAAGNNRDKKLGAKKAATKLYHTETFAGPDELQTQLSLAEPYFDKVFDKIDQMLPMDPGARNTSIRLWIREIINNEHSLGADETSHWKEMLIKFGMYISHDQGNLLEDFFTPLTSIFYKEDDGTKWAQLLDYQQ